MNVAICLFHRDENSYLPEWLEHHRGVGIDHFYIYDNGSASPPAAAADVTVVDFSHDHEVLKQMRAYHRCHEEFRRRHDWIGFIDTDEFVVGDLRRLLKRLRWGWLSRVTQVCLSTRVYGSNGLETRPPRQFGSYGDWWMTLDHVKSFVHCGRPLRSVPGDPHFLPCLGITVDALGRRQRGPLSPHVDEPVVVHHYFTRSRAEWAEKCARGRGDGIAPRSLAEFDYFNRQVAHFRRERRPPGPASGPR